MKTIKNFVKSGFLAFYLLIVTLLVILIYFIVNYNTFVIADSLAQLNY